MVLALVVLLLTARTLWRVPTTSRDGLMVHTSAAMWLAGENPYDQAAYLDRLAMALGGPDDVPVSAISLYMPSTYLLLSPWSLLDWPIAKWLMVVLSGVSAVGLGVWLSRLASEGRSPPVPWWAGCLLVGLWSPSHTTVAMGHIGLVVMALLVGGVLALERGRWWMAALLIAVATAAKPLVGGLLVFLFLMRGSWRGFGLCCVTGLVILAAGALRLTLAGVDWFPAWQANIHAFSHSGSANPLLGSPQRIGMQGVSLIVHALTDHRAVAAAAGWAVVAGAAGCAAWRDRAMRRSTDENDATPDLLWLPAVLATASMLAGYHRYYDAVLLLLPMAWILSRWGRLSRQPARWGILAGLSIFLVLPNTQGVLAVLVERRWPGLTENTLWALTAQTHQTWIILAILAGLLWIGPRPAQGVDPTAGASPLRLPAPPDTAAGP